MMKRKLVYYHPLLLAVLLWLCTSYSFASPLEHPKLRRLEDEPFTDEYIVVLNSDNDEIGKLRGSSSAAASSILEDSLRAVRNPNYAHIRHSYHQIFQGFSARLSEEALQHVLDDPRVKYIELNTPYTTQQETRQVDVTWGLDRIDQNELPLDASFSYDYTGQGVTVYILDTGLLESHSEFSNGRKRAVCGGNFVGDEKGCQDGNGHGTHVAGTIGGQTFGIAKNANLVSLRVCKATGSCPRDGMIAALEHVASAPGKRVVNFSLSGDYSQAVEDAKQAILDAGGVVVEAAGNRSRDACAYSANSQASISVGAATQVDKQASFSNFGSCVDIWAPGKDIRSAMIGGSGNSEATLDGTSFATPHVAGIVALHLERGVAAKDMKQVLLDQAITGRLSGLGEGSPNLLAHMPLGLGKATATCPTDMIGRPCRNAADCCDGHACQNLGLFFRKGKCSDVPMRSACALRKSSGQQCLFNFACCSRSCEDRKCL